VPHTARTFTKAPDTAAATALVDEMSSGECHPLLSGGLPLVLYGKGKLGKLAQQYLHTIGRQPAQSIEYDEPADSNSCILVCIVTSPYVPIEQKLLKRGFKAVMPFYDFTEGFRQQHPLSNGWFAKCLSGDDKKSINKVMARWSDDISRAHHLQFIAWRRLRQEWSFDNAPLPPEQFFIPEITSVLHDHEVFVDGGAHHGQVTLAFIDKTKGKFRKIIAIEPDLINRIVFRELVPQHRSIEVKSFALANEWALARFCSGFGLASQLSDIGHAYVTTQPLDFLKEQPTFIKLHLEGGELPALKGAMHTLVTERPIIAATICHNDDGLWRTPQWLMRLLEDYRFLFRLHYWCGSGGIIYAIPNERAA